MLRGILLSAADAHVLASRFAFLELEVIPVGVGAVVVGPVPQESWDSVRSSLLVRQDILVVRTGVMSGDWLLYAPDGHGARDVRSAPWWRRAWAVLGGSPPWQRGW